MENLVLLLSFALLIQVSFLQGSAVGSPIPFFTGVGVRNSPYVQSFPQLKPFSQSMANLTYNWGSILTNNLPVKVSSTGSSLLSIFAKFALDVLKYSPTIKGLFLPNFSFANISAAQMIAPPMSTSVMPDFQSNLIALLNLMKNTTEPNIFVFTRLLGFVPPLVIASFASFQQNFDIVFSDLSTVNSLMDLEETQGINNANFLLTNGQDIISSFNSSTATIQMLNVNLPLMISLNTTYIPAANGISGQLAIILNKALATQNMALGVSKNGTQPFIQAIMNTNSGFALLFNQTRANVQIFIDTVQSRNSTLSNLWNSNYNATCGQQMQLLNQTGWYLGNASANIPTSIQANYISLTNSYYGQISLLRSRVVDVGAKLGNWCGVLKNLLTTWTTPIQTASASVFGQNTTAGVIAPIGTVINTSLNDLVLFLQKVSTFISTTQGTQGTKSVALVQTPEFISFKNKLPTIQSVLNAISLVVDGPAAGFRQTIQVNLDTFQQVLAPPPVVYGQPSFKLPPAILTTSLPIYNFGDAVYAYDIADLLVLTPLSFTLARNTVTPSAITPQQGYPSCLFSVPVYPVSYSNQNYIQTAIPIQYSDYETSIQLANIHPRGELNPLVTFQFPVPPVNVVVPANPIQPAAIGSVAIPSSEPLNGWNNNMYSVRLRYFDNSVIVSITASDTGSFLNLIRSGNGPLITLTVTPTVVMPAL